MEPGGPGTHRCSREVEAAVVEVSLDLPQITGRKWPPKHAGWLVHHWNRLRYISFPLHLRSRWRWMGVRRDVVTRPHAGRSRSCARPPELGALDPPAGTDDQSGGPPLGGVPCALLPVAVWVSDSREQRQSRQVVFELGLSAMHFHSWMYCTFDSLFFFSRYAPSIQIRLSARE